MKNYKVKATRSFIDGLEKTPRQISDVFECTKERYEFLLEHDAVELVKILPIEQEPIEYQNIEDKKPKKTTKKKTTKKKSE